MEKQTELKRFLEEISSNSEVRDELLKHNEVDGFSRKLVEHGERLGYDFTEDDVREHLETQRDRELTSRELDRGTGGGDVITALFSYIAHCNSDC